MGKRFNDNSKMIVVEGPPAIGKTEFAMKLADELDMKFMPGFTMENYYINDYGYDLRELDYQITLERALSYDEKKFSQDPTGQDGGYDRMLWQSHQLRYQKYVDALAHIFNTGQGIVTERSPFSDFIYMDAGYQQGWVDKTTKDHFYKVRKMMIGEVLRPHVVIHLNAPTSVVQQKIRERADTTHPWEKNSPVWENTAYMESVYQAGLAKYLSAASSHSEVLSYDWSEGGDFEVVVEDIEALNLDWHDKYDLKQKDWRLFKEEYYAEKRAIYTNKRDLVNQYMYAPFFKCHKLLYTTEEALELDKVISRVPGNLYVTGFNQSLGDPDPFIFGFGKRLKFLRGQSVTQAADLPAGCQRDPYWHEEVVVREHRKALGDKDWWKN